MSSGAQLEDVLKAILGIDVLACSHEPELTHDGERRLVLGCDGRDEVIDALRPCPPDQRFHSLGRIALPAMLGKDPVPDLERVFTANRIDTRLAVEANVPDHDAASLPTDDGACEPAPDVRVLAQLTNPPTEEALHGGIGRLGR